MQDLLEYAVTKAERQGASQVEAYFICSETLRVGIEKKQVKTSEKKQDAGMGIRLAMKSKTGFSIGFSYLTDLTRKAADTAVKQAIIVASCKKPDPAFTSFPVHKPAKSVQRIYDKEIVAIGPDKIVGLAADLIKSIDVDKRIATIGGGLGVGSSTVAISNSLGVRGKYEKTSYSAYGYVVAKQKDSVGVGGDGYSSCFFEEENAYSCFKNAQETALKQLNPRTVKTQKMDLLLQPEALSFLLAFTLIPAVRADNVQKKQSLLAGKLNQMVASENLTVLDDGLIPQANGSRPFDDEGYPTQTTTVIDEGRLRNFLYDSYSAGKDKVKSTGNASRALGGFTEKQKYMAEPVVGPNNFKLQPARKSVEDELGNVTKEVKNGIIAKEVIGAHTANAASGEFSVVLDSAFKIEKGEIRYPVKQAMLGGNIIEILKNIALFADDAKQVGESLITPTILIKDLRVSG